MKRPTLKIWGIVIVLVLVLLALGSWFIWSRSRVARPSQKILVSITNPANDDRFPVGGALRIRAEAVSDDPIQRMELWVDGNMVEEYSPGDQTLYYLANNWKWSPKDLGAHALVVRAYAADGSFAQSNIVNIAIDRAPGHMLVYITRAGDTLESIAQSKGSTTDMILLANPDLSKYQNKTLPPGLEIRIPVNVDASAFRNHPNTHVARGNLNDPAPVIPAGYQVEAIMPGSALVFTSSPNLTVLVQGCAASLNITAPDAKPTGYLIYRLNQGGSSFVKIASIPAGASGNASYNDQGLAVGKYQYYVAAYTSGLFAASSGNPSNIAAADIFSAACSTGGLSVVSLLPAAGSSDQVYLYLTTNGKDWFRFPQNEFTFMKSSQQIDLLQMASMAFPGVKGDFTLKGEGWSWNGGVLVFLGTFERKLSSPPSYSPNNYTNAPFLLTDFLSTKLEARGSAILDTNNYLWADTAAYSQYATSVYRWGTNTGADSGLWQVASAPFDSTPSLDPPCLLLTGTAAVGDLQSPKEFPVNFSSLKPADPVAQNPKSGSNQMLGGQFLTLDLSPNSPPYSPKEVLGQPAGQFEKTIPNAIADPCGKSSTDADGTKTYYIRILPVKDGQLLSPTSNTVVIKFSPPPPSVVINYAPTNTFYDIKILDFTEPSIPDTAYSDCVKIVKNPYYGTASPWGNDAVGDIVCPTPYTGGSGSILDDVVDFVKNAINFVANLYNELSDFVTTLVEQLNPACFTAKFIADEVGSGQQQVEDACHSIAVVAVTAAKTYVGLPPSLPNYDQLTSMGKDYVVELAADQLESTGVPCPQECKDLIAKGVDYAIAAAKSAANTHPCLSEDEAHSRGEEPLCFPSEIETVPDPRGVYAPSIAQIQVTRRMGTDGPGIAQPAYCYANLNGMATNDSYVGQTKEIWFGQVYYTWQGTSLNASLLSGGTPIPALAPGQSVQIPVVLDPVPYWLPGHYSWYKQWINVADYDDWAMLYTGADLALTAGGDCSFPGYYDPGTTTVLGETKHYGPLGNTILQMCGTNCP